MQHKRVNPLQTALWLQIMQQFHGPQPLTVSCHNRVYIPCIYVLNKIDQISIEELDIIYKVPHCVPISAHHRWNFDDLLERMWDYLQLVRM